MASMLGRPEVSFSWGAAPEVGTASSSGDRKTMFAAHLKALNSQFATWVAGQQATRSGEVWTDGVQDYVAHASKLLSDFRDVLDAQASAGPAATPPFSFGPPLAVGPGAPAGTSAPEEGSDAEGSEGEEGGAAELEVGAGSDTVILAKQRVRLSSLTEDRKWKQRGAGTLTLRRGAGGGQPYVVFTTDAGKLLVNGTLVPNIKPGLNSKAPANLNMFLVSHLEKETMVDEGGKQSVRSETVEERGLQTFRFDSPDAMQAFRKEVMQFY